EEGFRTVAQAGGEGGGDGRHDQHGGGVVEKGRDRHGGDHDERQRAPARQAGGGDGKPSGDQIGAAGGLEAFGNRNETGQHDENGAVDLVIDFPQGQGA